MLYISSPHPVPRLSWYVHKVFQNVDGGLHGVLSKRENRQPERLWPQGKSHLAVGPRGKREERADRERRKDLVWVCGRLGRSGRLDFAAQREGAGKSGSGGSRSRQRPSLHTWANEGQEKRRPKAALARARNKRETGGRWEKTRGGQEKECFFEGALVKKLRDQIRGNLIRPGRRVKGPARLYCLASLALAHN
jgi:hypothetical protein